MPTDKNPRFLQTSQHYLACNILYLITKSCWIYTWTASTNYPFDMQEQVTEEEEEVIREVMMKEGMILSMMMRRMAIMAQILMIPTKLTKCMM